MNLNKWGTPQSVDRICDGAAWVSSAGHGGLVLSPKFNALVPAQARVADGGYEEDVDWSIAWLSLRKAGVELSLSEKEQLRYDEYALKSLNAYHPDLVKLITGQDPDPDSPALRERRDYARARAEGFFLPISAAGNFDHNPVGEGMVGAIVAPPHASIDQPDLDRQFFIMIKKDTYNEGRLEGGMRALREEDFVRINFDPFRRSDIEALTSEEAYDIATRWGSYIWDGDEGKVFYTFPFEDARPQSPDHRMQLMRYTGSCMAMLDVSIAEQQKTNSDGQNARLEEDLKDRDDLNRLMLFFASSEMAPEPAHDVDEPGF